MKSIIKILLLIITLGFVLQGCYLKSLHPLFNPDDLRSVPGLEGIWEDSSTRWGFYQSNKELLLPETQQLFNEWGLDQLPEESYIVIFENLEDLEEEKVYFLGSVGALNNRYFIEFNIIYNSSDTFKSIHLLPVRTIARLELDEDNLSLSFFIDEWIGDLIEDHRIRIKHEKVQTVSNDEPTYLITAQTPELQSFISKYANDEKAFDDKLELRPVGKNSK